MSTKIMYKGEVLDTIENESRKMTTANTLMEDHVTLVNEGGGVDGDISQDEDGYIVFDDGEYEEIEVRPRVYTVNRTDVARDGIGYNPVTVDVDNTKIILERDTTIGHHLYLSSNITSIPSYAFYGCSALEEIHLVNEVTSIGDYAFYGCSGLKKFIIPSTITSISNFMFHGCSALEELNVPNTITKIDSYAFCYCSSLKNIYVPNVTSCSGVYIFANCTSLEGVVLPSIVGVTAGHCFAGSTAIQYIDFGENFDRVNSTDAFLNCSSLKNLIIRKPTLSTLSNISNFNGTPFADGGVGGTLYVPQALISEYQSATNWSTILGYDDNQILPIEGSQYENYYADGTPIGG